MSDGNGAAPAWTPTPSAEVLRKLKPFQRAAVEHAFERLFGAADGTRKFLVADEVGLGKTHVARGLIAKAIEHLQARGRERIDVVYICSNRQIARQNVRKLGGDAVEENAERLTLLPLSVHELRAQKVNFVAFTPGTSFDLASRLGTGRERLLLLTMLEEKWTVGGTGPLNLFQGTVLRTDRFRDRARSFRRENPIDADLEAAFHAEVDRAAEEMRTAGQPDLEQRYRELCDRFRYQRERWPPDLRDARNEFIREVRERLAHVCIHALEPDLVILDEFQRFKHLLDGDGDAALLARRLFEYAADEAAAVRVVLLSATPYKAYTLTHERDEEDHYQDFLATVRFLDPDAERHAGFEARLKEWRRAFFALGTGGAARLAELRRELEAHLRRIVSRTERVGVAGDRDSMLREIPEPAPRLTPRDVLAFAPLQELARELGRPRVVEYWKAAPYPLSFMEDYVLKHELEDRLERKDQGQLPALLERARAAGALLDPAAIAAYAPLDVPHPALRCLAEDLERLDAFRCLWIAPSLPHWKLDGPFATAQAGGITKRLLFSAWKVAPRAIASLLSYEAERRLVSELEGPAAENTPEARKSRQSYLALDVRAGKPGEMSVFTLLYPSAALAELGDPVKLRESSADALPSFAELRASAAAELRPALERLRRFSSATGAADPSWYWAGPMLLDLDRHPHVAREFWNQGEPSAWTTYAPEEEDDPESAWERHVEHAWEVLHDVLRGRRALGPMPDDLPEVLASIALTGPATVILRALTRCESPGVEGPSVETRNAAAELGWAFRSLLRRPESTAAIRVVSPHSAYWQSVLDYSAQGCLAAVIEEWVHLSVEQNGIENGWEDVVADMDAALTLRATSHDYDHFVKRGSRVEVERRSLRAHFALRFGSEKSEDDTQVQREQQVRQAFNSPFWPFVLCSTSVGQEGLDFHTYCHAIVHWNLPSNPVDMEQREGRVHRFKNHAVRKNVAAIHGARGLELVRCGAALDPWCAAFDLAEAEARSVDRGLVPCWIFPGTPNGARIERHVPHLPVSRDAQRARDMRIALTTYRLVFGQPRQEDLLAWLRGREHLLGSSAVEELQIDLRPGALGRSDLQT